MKLLLYRPNSQIKAATIPLGMGYLAHSARQAGHEVKLVDGRLERLSGRAAAQRALSENPEVVGVSAIHFEYESARSFCRELATAGHRGKTILGGPLVSTLGEEFVREGLVDAAVRGEGETALVQYLSALESGTGLPEVPGLLYLDRGEFRENPPRLFEDLDQLEIAWDLIHPPRYFKSGRHTLSMLRRSHQSLSLFTSRGCPFGCIYCHNVFGKKFRRRSPESVIEELQRLKRDYGVEEVEFVDDAFNLDLPRAKTIAAMILEQDLKLHLSFSNGLRADRMDQELLDLLKRAGTYRINYAVETACPRLQKLIHKNLDLERTARVVEWTADRGIFTLGYFMLGFPTETLEELTMTADYALRSKFHAAAFFHVNPFPNTELAKNFDLPPGWQESAADLSYDASPLNLSDVPDQVLRRTIKSLYRRFHFHPSRLWRAYQVTPKNWDTVRSVAIIAMLGLRDLKSF